MQPGNELHSHELQMRELRLRDRLLDGDRDTIESFFKGVFDPLYEFTYYRVGCDRTLAESIVQDTLTTGFEKLKDFEGRSTLHAWLYGIAKNKIRALRRARRPKSIDELLEDASAEIDAILVKIETEPLPDEVMERKETRELVGAALSSLPPNYREILIAKYVDDLQINEIANRSGRGFKATESLLQRARVAFARVFELLAKKRGELP
jgi:RNA polymerase sigma-70 factor (ECF subfamily)